jgi:ATP-dependent Clp protease protease subunit
MAGDEVLMSPAGSMMIHQPWTRASGDAREMEKTAAMLDEISGSLVNAYVAKTGKSESEIRRLMDEETWMNARSAVEMGFADGIWEEGREQYAPAAAAVMQTGNRHSEKSVLNRAMEWQRHEGRAPDFLAKKMNLPADADAAANAQASADLEQRKRRLKLLAKANMMD